ncbi:hypothetical protein [Microbulbifer sp. Q7]|uniref:hypothetical protein n=1 Tax=Microbulbifer sp. Q7 TaxID=1785091 RepID=UPI0008320152|nr:hypothetical protein [Microbulbifer sp. Q7]
MGNNNKLTLAATALGSAISLAAVPAFADDWAFSVAPLYLWAKSVEGTSSAGGIEAPLDLDFQDDILENLEAAFSIHAEATNGTITFFAEYNYAKLKPSNRTEVGPVEVRSDIDFRDVMIEGGLGWTLVSSDSGTWELLGGLRYIEQDMTVKFSNSLPGDSSLFDRLELGDSWTHPFAGVRYTSVINKCWRFRVRGDFGYGGSDNRAFHAIGLFDYQFRDWGSAFAGYRYLSTYFANGKDGLSQYGFDGDQQGPVLGVNFYF